MTIDYKAQVMRIFNAMNERDLGAFDETVAASYVNHDMPAPAPGPEGLKAVIGAFIEGFPDMRIHVAKVISEGDAVATRGHFDGTHRGAFMGIPATGKRVHVKYIDMWRFEGGKAVENWVTLDMLGMMQQLGVVPSPG